MLCKCAWEKTSEEAAKPPQDKAAEYCMPAKCSELVVPIVQTHLLCLNPNHREFIWWKPPTASRRHYWDEPPQAQTRPKRTHVPPLTDGGSYWDFHGRWRHDPGLARLTRFTGNYAFCCPSQDYKNQKPSFPNTKKGSVHQRNKNDKS